MLLFIAHAQVTPSGVQCRFYGASAVTAVTLNGVALHAVTKVCIDDNVCLQLEVVHDDDSVRCFVLIIDSKNL